MIGESAVRFCSTTLERNCRRQGRSVPQRADPDFFLAHWDVLADSAQAAHALGTDGAHPWIDVLVRLARASVASIAESVAALAAPVVKFVLACDMRCRGAERAYPGGNSRSVSARALVGNPDGAACRPNGRGRGSKSSSVPMRIFQELAERYGYARPDSARRRNRSSLVDAWAQRLALLENMRAGRRQDLDERRHIAA